MVEHFLEENNMTYLYLLLANLEIERLNNLPFTVKKSFKGQVTEMALNHVAHNNVPDYMIPVEEEETTEEI